MEFLRAHRERGNAPSPKDREPLGSIEDIWTPAAQMATVGIFILLLGAFLYFCRPVLLPVVAAAKPETPYPIVLELWPYTP